MEPPEPLNRDNLPDALNAIEQVRQQGDEPLFPARRIRDHDMELAMRPLPDAWETLMGRDPDAPRIVSISNPFPPNDAFREAVMRGDIGGGISAVGYPTFEEPRDPGVMDPRNPAGTPFHMEVPTVRASEATSMADLFGDTLGDLRFRDATSPTDAARARARAKRRKRKR